MPQTLSSDTPDKGRLRIHVDSALTRSPVENARIRIFDTGQPEKALEEIGTDTNGNSETVELPAPPIEYSMEPSENQPYSEYTFQIQADGFEPLSISGAELFSGSLALQDVRLSPLKASGDFQNYTIPAHTLLRQLSAERSPRHEVKPVTAIRGDRPEPGGRCRSTSWSTTAPPGTVQPIGLLCPLHGLHQECGLQRDLRHLAKGGHRGQCAGYSCLLRLNRVYSEWYRNIRAMILRLRHRLHLTRSGFLEPKHLREYFGCGR